MVGLDYDSVKFNFVGKIISIKLKLEDLDILSAMASLRLCLLLLHNTVLVTKSILQSDGCF